MNRRRAIPLLLLGACVMPQAAWANAGTPLMWAGAAHLLFGNLFIGLLEGFLLSWLFDVPRRKATATMILANYVSAWAGAFFIQGVGRSRLSIDLASGWTWFWIMVAATYCLTLLVEWPFIASALRGSPSLLARSLRASVILQSASYIPLFGWYWMASGTSLYTQMRVVDPAALSLPGSVHVYYIAPADGAVHRRSLSGGTDQRIFDLQSKSPRDRLFVEPSAADSNRWDLGARLQTDDGRGLKFVPVLTNLLVEAAPVWNRPSTPKPWRESSWFSFGEAPSLGGASGEWTFKTGFWPNEGLQAVRKSTGERTRFAYETPFSAWAVRNAVHLSTDKALFQLGDDQVCAFDPATHQVALLWHGRGPVPVLLKAGETPPR